MKEHWNIIKESISLRRELKIYLSSDIVDVATVATPINFACSC
jgi:hypothetical protein